MGKKKNVGCLVKPFISEMSELSEVFIHEVCLLTLVSAFPTPCLTFASLPVPKHTRNLARIFGDYPFTLLTFL